jgi:archaemetzincin
MAFEPPGPGERRRAIGPTASLPEVMRRALAADEDFQPIPAPAPIDWLAVHAEPGQTFAQFAASGPNRPDAQRRIIYLQPLGEFPTNQSPSLARLREGAAAYFQMEVKTLAPLEVSAHQVTTRVHPVTQKRQLLAPDLLALLKQKLPADAFCLLGITMADLYPEPSWNFVFGQASLRERVGVYSFARYDPAFFGQERPDDYQTLLLRRSCKVLAHETAHMFSLQHCIYFDCAINGSNNLRESDRRPLRLCPVCLRKLQLSIGFDVVKRYQALAEFYRAAGFADEAQWVRNRLGKLRP